MLRRIVGGSLDGGPTRQQPSASETNAPGRFIRLIIRRRRLVVLATLAVVAVAAVSVTHLRLNADLVSYLNANNPLVRTYRYVGDAFGGNEMGLALVSVPDAYEPRVLAFLSELTEAYQETEGVEYATSLTNVMVFSPTEDGVEVGHLIGTNRMPPTEADAAEIRDRVDANPRLSGNLVSTDGTLAAIQLRFGGEGAERAVTGFATAVRVSRVTEELLATEDAPTGVTVQFGGLPFLMYNMTTLIAGNMTILVPLMLGFLVLVLYIGFRRWAGVVLPLLVVFVSSVLVLGVMGVLGLQVDLLSGLVPVVLIALGSADGIHYMKRYYEQRASGRSSEDAAAISFQDIRVPLILTTITTMVGFSSLAISDFAIIRQFGLLTAFGLLLALLVTLTLLPALASYALAAPVSSTVTSRSGFMSGLARGIARAPAVLLTAGLIAVVSAGAGMFLIVKSVDWTLCLKRGSPPHHAEMLVREKLSGSLPLQLLVQGDLLDPAALTAMRRLERRMDALPFIGKSQSLAGVIAEINSALNGRYAVPSTRAGVANLWFLIENEKEIEQLVARGGTAEGLVQGRVSEWETNAVIQAVEGVDRWLETQADEMAVVDRRELPDAADSVVDSYQALDLATQLEWEFAGRGEEAPAALANIARSFVTWAPAAPVRDRVRAAVMRYLTGDEAEVLLDEVDAVQLAERLGDAVGVWGIDAAFAEAEVRRVASDIDAWEREALGQSLEAVTADATGAARVSAAMAALDAATPIVARDSVLRRNARGALWEAHGPLLFVDGAAVGRWGLRDETVTRTVPVSIRRAGLASVLKQMEEELLPTQIKSVVVTLAVVTVMLALMFRSPVAGVLMVLPLAGAIVVNLGTMGYLSIGLDSFTAIIASITIGLGVDYAIHFTHRYRHELARAGGQATLALVSTMKTSGVAILVNAVSVGLGFLVLLAAGGQHIRRFGGLTSLAMLVAGLFTLLLLPALYLWWRPRFLLASRATGMALGVADGRRPPHPEPPPHGAA